MRYTNLVYEIRLDGKVMEVEYGLWDKIRHKVRNNEWFYIVYGDNKYKYTKDQEYYDRPSRFEFESLSDDYEEEIEVIVIENKEVVH